MLRNEDRLYHVIVSFPSICANQFLILKFRKNEAICCLIGFGIGIGCCIVYRWFKNTFFSMAVDNLDSHTNQSTKNNDKQLLFHLRNDHYNQCLHRPRIKKNKKYADILKQTASTRSNFSSNNYYHNNIKNDFLTRTNSKSQLYKKLQLSQASHSVSNNDFNEPLNDVYQNLTKFLNNQFFKTFRMRRPKSKRYKYYLENNCNIFKLSTTPTRLNTSPNSNQISKQTLNSLSIPPNTETNSIFSTELTKAKQFKSKVNSYSFCEDSLSNLNNYNNDGYYNNNNILQKAYSDNLDEYFARENFMLNFDDDSLELFKSTNRHSDNSSWDSNDITDSKTLLNPMTKSTNSVDKSLEEALLQIDRLKEDMTHLCKDIDSLYNTKASAHELDELLAKYENEIFDINNLPSDSTVPFLNKYMELSRYTSNSSYKNSLIKEEDEIREGSRMVKKQNCSCIYSMFSYNLNEKKVNSSKSTKPSTRRSSSSITKTISTEDINLIVSYADKGSQTNIDLLSTSQKTNKCLNKILAMQSKFSKKRQKYCNLSEKHFSKRYCSKRKSLKYI